jgi:GNAT superfamily N-acetyltransferase
MIEIGPAGASDIPGVIALFRQYQESLGVDLGFQGFEAELKALPGRYAPPSGRLLVGRSGNGLSGCVALQSLGGEECEMKRLYVRPDVRGSGLGRRLVERLIEEARAIGYRRMRLDTLPGMKDAIRLYEALGFADVPAYRFNPVAGTRYLALDLAQGGAPPGAGS